MKQKDLIVNRVIHPNDGMWKTGQAWYYSVGESGLAAIQGTLALSRNRKVSRILDLPCGYGRVGRYLRAAYSHAAITFCDLEKSAVDFCAQEFHGLALYSVPELSELPLEPIYDIIWVGSLFTHVDEMRTRRWLRHLCSALAPHGVLVTTFHGRWALEQQKRHRLIDDSSWSQIEAGFWETGFGYHPYRQLDLGDYGVSAARPHRIVAMVEQIEGIRLLVYCERGWAENHDVLGIGKTDRLETWGR